MNDFAQAARTTRRKYASLHRALLVLLLVLAGTTVKAQTGSTSVVELTGQKLLPNKLQAICQQKAYAGVGAYRWQNHLVAYGPTTQIRQLVPVLKKAYTSANIKVYDAPFYKFDRSRCPNKATAKQWDNILLTCNLVEDKAKQQEYMQYHATQFEQWPEVATGFCNARFQQLLVFRQGRQLMLVISIPKGQSLDELNPRTTLNNPRVNDWNALMKQYQTGLPGTKPGEAWVFLQPVAPAVQLRTKTTIPQTKK
ncbi:L-rhamnose mutarotase [Hymenobacter sp. BT186]|uniref:L-rhamnose mutarotase n=1 Tax=Hymenobacter telluris TaxID=2816474 RepID=A0A939EVI1_9BACT|nr:L-rhamnose mutarotase [Hymenobacter telluris]MBO0356678.1 L-rhamnose mutarotase [Hymenobacter telluris]MBW3372703.1 L-rhamnose mutarotase [Hymenobacter norwichensis]